VVNNDTELLPQTYRTLLIARGSCGLVTGVSVDRDPEPPAQVLSVSPHPDYSCFLITRETHRRVPFDERYVGAYFEDGDHHVRLHRAGIPAGSLPLEFRHRRSSTLRYASPQEKRRIEENFERNQQRFLRQYGCLPCAKVAYAQLFV
jgi:GT2 family glycosyltransferase